MPWYAMHAHSLTKVCHPAVSAVADHAAAAKTIAFLNARGAPVCFEETCAPPSHKDWFEKGNPERATCSKGILLHCFQAAMPLKTLHCLLTCQPCDVVDRCATTVAFIKQLALAKVIFLFGHCLMTSTPEDGIFLPM